MTAPVIPVAFGNGKPQQRLGPETPWSSHTAVILALGIAHPDRVAEHCHQQRYPITERLTVGDHELFPKEKLETLTEKTKAILTTEKDFWRQSELLSSLKVPVYVLPLDLAFPESFSLSDFLP
jgi:tetraacyldisaccharide-1-P 4'-kinase